MRTAVAAVVAAVSALGACSFIGVHGPPSTLPDEGAVECTNTHGLVFVDGVAATLELGVSAALLVGSRDDKNFELGAVLMAPVVLLGVIHAASAIYGYSTVSACERANHEMASRPRSPISPTPPNASAATSGMF